MSESLRLLGRRIAKIGAQPTIKVRTVFIRSVTAVDAKVTMSGVNLQDPIPMDANLGLVPGSFARMQIEDGVARIVAKQA